MCHDSTDRKKGIFLRTRKHIYENMHPKIIFAKFQTHANIIPSTTLLIILIWRRYPDVETRERNERAWRGCDAVGCHSNAVSFYYLWYGAIYKRQYTNKHVTLNKCMCIRSLRARLENFGIFTFLNCYFFQYFVGTLKISHGLISFGGGGQAPPPPHQYASAL